MFTEGEEQGEHGPRRADVEGGLPPSTTKDVEATLQRQLEGSRA